MSCVQEIQDRPGIVDIWAVPKGKPVIPFFYAFLLPPKPLGVQSGKYLLLRETKGGGVFLRGSGHYFQVVQVRKDGLLADAGDACHDRPFQPGVCLEGGIEHRAGKGRHLIPVAVYIGFLHRGVVFVQEDDYFFPAAAGQHFGQTEEGEGSVHVVHIYRDTSHKCQVLFRKL